jgi:hypothetical protein
MEAVVGERHSNSRKRRGLVAIADKFTQSAS